MRLLISNDDGIHSAGLATLAKVAAQFGDVIVAAPEVENSSASHAISASRPPSFRRARIRGGFEAYRVDGTPADCVALGIFHHPDIDVVLSGVNLGTNLGNGIWHSGTMAAARQASLLGMRGIALSTPVISDDPDLTQLEPYLARVLELLLPRDDLRMVNVHLPARARGIHWARQAAEKYDGEVVPTTDPYGRPVYWLAVTQLREHAAETDLWAFERGYITITPLRLDLTDHAELAGLDAQQRVVEFEDELAPQVISDEEAADDEGEQLRSSEWTGLGESKSTNSSS
ncbi:5'/3'-nucleotidase SurE [soil metagenome]